MHTQVSLDKESMALVYMVLAVGAAATNDTIGREQISRIRLIRESAFAQAMSISPSLYGQLNLQNVQVLALFVRMLSLLERAIL
jgi:hypothetical protein